MLYHLYGISWVALRWHSEWAEGVRRVVWVLEIHKNFFVTLPFWECSVSHRLRLYWWGYVGCGGHAYIMEIIIMISSYYFLQIWPCVDTGLVKEVSTGNHHYVSKLAFSSVELVLTWPPDHPWSGFQTQLFHVVPFRPSSLHRMSRNGTFPWTISYVSLSAKTTVPPSQ